jgi:hypothetical protein
LQQSASPESAGIHRRTLIATALRSLGAVSLAPLLRAGSAWTPKSLTAGQNDALVAIGERILPGSAAAQCNRVIDLVMNVETAEIRTQLTTSLAAFDTAARDRHGKLFKDLSTGQQDALLAIFAQDRDRNHPFTVVKEWIADTYWSSREGLRELGWNGQMAWPNAQACENKPG